MKYLGAVLVSCCLVGAVVGWRVDHVSMSDNLAKEQGRVAELIASNASDLSRMDEMDADNAKLKTQYSQLMDQEDKALDERNKYSDQIEGLRQQTTILQSKLDQAGEDNKALSYELTDETKLYQEMAALEKQRATDFNDLLADYKEVCRRYSISTPPPLNGQIQYTGLVGDAAQPFERSTDGSRGNDPGPPTHQFSVTPTGNGTATVTGY